MKLKIKNKINEKIRKKEKKNWIYSKSNRFSTSL